MKKFNQKQGFSLIELLIAIAIIGLLATVMMVAFNSTRDKARDAKRKADLSQIGKFLVLSCFLPQAGAGEYGLADLFSEVKAKYPQISNYIASLPQDPKTSNNHKTNYKYIIDTDNKCLLYANLENPDETITLAGISAPAPGKGTGVFQSSSSGWNGTNKFFLLGKNRNRTVKI